MQKKQNAKMQYLQIINKYIDSRLTSAHKNANIAIIKGGMHDAAAV